MRKNKFILFDYSLTPESGIKKITDLNLFCFYSYVIFTNAKVESIRNWIFTGARVTNITHKPI